jgi:hypothetical protein
MSFAFRSTREPSVPKVEMLRHKASLEGRDRNITDLVNHITDSAVGLIEVATMYS